MLSAKHRTSFALDEETLRLLQQLAGQWRVSQAEVVRRSVRLAVEQDRTNTSRLRERLGSYQEAGHLSSDEAEGFLGRIAAERADWGRGQ
ncbi:MAG: ribbon-helix-helix protein, CopG family [Spirochaetaceae bacterium]|nr:MAG: ribbon-helix-helix protein, CopG family [Spirochaetaceae bacterium]